MSVNLDSTKLSQLCGLEPYNKIMILTPENPMPWDQMLVTSEDANGNSLITEYYLGSIFQFKVTKTFNAQDVCTSILVE